MTMNFIDFVAKASAAYLTSSKSLFAEAIHSSLDFLNQCILFFGLQNFEIIYEKVLKIIHKN